ncbi:MarR family winged helix-turn-helix transcriptional regulator [Pseudomonas sp. LB1P83]
MHVIIYLDFLEGIPLSKAPQAEAEDFAPLSEFLCFSIYSAGHAFTQLYRPLLDSVGLTYPQYLLMVALWAKDHQIVKNLGHALFLDSSTLTPLIKRLEAAGFIGRTRDLRDERQVIISLTDKGRALKARALEVPACIDAALGLPPTDIVKLQKLLSNLRDRIVNK